MCLPLGAVGGLDNRLTRYGAVVDSMNEKQQAQGRVNSLPGDIDDQYGDNGAGLSASHQTESTGLVARSLDLFTQRNPRAMRELPEE